MKPAAFQYLAPDDLPAALAAMAKYGDWAKLIAGGQSLVPMMNMRLAQPSVLIDLNGVSGLAGIARDGNALAIGAMVRHHELATAPLVREACPILAAAAATIGHYAIRQRGTIGGSLSHADPAAQLPLIAMLLDATIDIAAAGAARRLPARDFLRGIMTTALEPHEIVTAIRFPCPPPGSGWGFQLFERRAGDFALALAAVTVELDARGMIGDLRVALGGVESRPMLWRDGDGRWTGRAADPVCAAEIAAGAVAAAVIEDDPRVSAVYRRELAQTLLRRALADAFDRAAKR